MKVTKEIKDAKIDAAKGVLVANGVDDDEAFNVLRSVVYELFGLELDEGESKRGYVSSNPSLVLYEVKVSNIVWDFDGLDDCDIPKLPNKDTVTVICNENCSDDEIENAISEQLCGDYGFCNKGYKYKIVNVSK